MDKNKRYKMNTHRVINHLSFLDDLAGKYYYNSNKIDKAITIEKKKISIVKKLYKKDKKRWTNTYIKVLKDLAQSYHIKNEFGKTIKLEKKVLRIFKKLKKKVPSQLTLLSALYFKNNQIKKSIKYSKKTILLYKKDNFIRMEEYSYTLSILAKVYRKNNQIYKALSVEKKLDKVQKKYFSNSDKMLKEIKKDFKYYRYISSKLKNDKKFIQSAIIENGAVLQYLDDSIKLDKNIVWCAIVSNHTSIEYADEKLQNDRAFILESIAINPLVFILLKEKFKNDDEFVYEAMINSSGYIFPYISKRLKAYKKLENLYKGLVCQDKMN